MPPTRFPLAGAVQRLLVPDPPVAGPDGFTRVQERIAGDLPHTIQLMDDVSVMVVVPTGLAATWRDIDPLALVTHSDMERSAAQPTDDLDDLLASRAPGRLIVRVGGAIVGALPLAVGRPWRVPGRSGERDGVRLELAVLGWDIRAGSLRGGGDVGSFIDLAWRRTDLPVLQFSTPPPSPRISPRLPERLQSSLGLDQQLVLPLIRARLSLSRYHMEVIHR